MTFNSIKPVSKFLFSLSLLTMFAGNLQAATCVNADLKLKLTLEEKSGSISRVVILANDGTSKTIEGENLIATSDPNSYKLYSHGRGAPSLILESKTSVKISGHAQHLQQILSGAAVKITSRSVVFSDCK